jgi:hypothetical protein
MWVKRSDEELARANRRKRFGGVILVFAIATLFGVFGMFKTSFWETVNTGNVFVPSGERLARFPRLFISGLVISILFLIFGPRAQVVCPKCGKIERKDRFTKCECGGYFEYLHEMKWIDKK